MSRTLSMNSGSRLSLKAWLRWGCREKARQTRLMLLWLSPVTWAREHVDQCVAACGWLSKVHASTRSAAASLRRRGVPGLIEQSVEPKKDKTLSPLAHGPQRDMYAASDLGVGP